MQRVVALTVEEARDFFLAELQTVIARRGVLAESDSVDYLANLLTEQMESEKFFVKSSDGKLESPVLATMFLEYTSGNVETRKATLKRIGDVCLFVTGLFPESLQRKVVQIDYYFGMGGTAYGLLSGLQLSGLTRIVFAELSAKFKIFSNVLAELGERAGLMSNSDILALYERWLLTGDDRLRERLIENGIISPLVSAPKTFD